MNVDQWELFGPDTELHAGVAHTMRNRVNDRSLKYGDREFGINLVWDRSTALGNIRFDSGTLGAVIRFGDRVSINVTGGGHLDYGERDHGINLNWSATPTRQKNFSKFLKPGTQNTHKISLVAPTGFEPVFQP